MFTGVEDTILVQRHGQVGGEQFVIADCQNSILLVLDHVPSVTIDDCKNCVIVVGPCSGSVFVRDCTDCTIFAACQQFRCRDATISVHLFCTTEPVVEDTTATITRLNIKYPFLEEQMEAAGLLGKENQYDQVRDFTPDTSKFSVAANVPAFDLKNLLPKLNLIEIVASSKSSTNVQSQGRRFSIGADSDGEVENIVGQLLEEVNLDESTNEKQSKDRIESLRRNSKEEEEEAETRRSTATVSSTSYSRYGAEVLWRHHGATEVETSTDNQSKPAKSKRSAPVYTFEEFLRCSPSDDSDEDDKSDDHFKSKAASTLNQTLAFYDNPALEADDRIAHSSSTYQSINPFDSDWPGEVNSVPQSQHFVGHWKNGSGHGGDDRIGFYVLNERQQPRPSNQNSNSLDHRLRSALTNRSVSSTSSTLASSARPSATGAPRILCASSLTTEQIDEKPPDFEEPQRDQLHPVLQSSPGSILRDLLCCRPNDPPEQEERMSGTCWKALGSCFTRESGGRGNRAERYQMAETDPTTAPRQFSWERERPSAANYKFANAIDATLVKRRGDVSGQQFIIENCQNSILMVLDNLGSVTVDDCKSCVIILGPCSGSVFVRDCSDCTIFTVCQQFRSRDCSIMIHLFCATSPIIEETTAQFFPLFLKYPFIEENMNQSGLSPFTNYWYKVHDFTPETSQFTISQTPKPIENTYGPAHNWLPDLKAERLSIDPANSYFLFTPPTRSLETNEETILLLFNRPLKTEQPDKSSFYSTVISVIHRICADPQLTRLVVAHDLDIREGKLISVELAGPVDDCRQFVERILGPINYPGIFIQIVKPIETEIYRQNLNRLADVQSNI
ncbi:C-CAP/cofactor C-like domain-containing protein [Aphelenchoides besseyi]|nr:C-CAP/cofactor C-like domain-containing protein [Aphelenchoides besseyi]